MRIFNHSTPQAVSALEHGIADFAVVTTPVSTDMPLEVTPLMDFQEILVCGENFKFLSKKALSLRELNEYPLVMLGRDTMTNAFYNHLFLQHDFIWSPDIEVATTDQLLPMIRANLGIGFLPAPLAQDALEHHVIYQIPLQESIPLRQVTLLHDPRRPLSIAAKEFLKFL